MTKWIIGWEATYIIQEKIPVDKPGRAVHLHSLINGRPIEPRLRSLHSVPTSFEAIAASVSQWTNKMEKIPEPLVLPFPARRVQHVETRRHHPVGLHVGQQRLIEAGREHTMRVSLENIFAGCCLCQLIDERLEPDLDWLN